MIPAPASLGDDDASVQAILAQHVNASDLPAALVFNCHITGLAVARALGRRGVPVIGLDRDKDGVGLFSRYTTVAGALPSPLDDEDAFVARLVQIGRGLNKRAVLFPANDEWVLGVGRRRAELEEFYHIPWADEQTVTRILDKATLYDEAEKLGVPVPRTWRLDDEVDLERLVEQLPFPCILKPREQRSFTEAFGAKVFLVHNPDELRERLAQTAGHPVLLQDVVPVTPDGFHSLCAYVAPGGAVLGSFVGRKLEQYPPDFGTGCLVDADPSPDLAERGAAVLRALGYHGVAEVEFLYDPRDGEHKLLDVNTRIWKWIGLPIAAGVDLPWLAYATAVGLQPEVMTARDGRLSWVYLKDFAALRRARTGVNKDRHLDEEQWLTLISGENADATVVEAVLDRDDPRPFYRLIETELSGRRYFCAC